jgi:hypothetical protein
LTSHNEAIGLVQKALEVGECGPCSTSSPTISPSTGTPTSIPTAEATNDPLEGCDPVLPCSNDIGTTALLEGVTFCLDLPVQGGILVEICAPRGIIQVLLERGMCVLLLHPFLVAHCLTLSVFQGTCGSCPTAQPSDSPSSGPSLAPSIQPSSEPSAVLSTSPTVTDTKSPTILPTEFPTTPQPSLGPSVSPTGYPTAIPSVSQAPSSQPTGLLENCEPIVSCGDERVLFCLDIFDSFAPVTVCLRKCLRGNKVFH